MSWLDRFEDEGEGNDNDDTPGWARRLERKVKIIMAAIDDLNAAVSTLETDAAAENTELGSVVSALQTTQQQLSDLQATIAAGGSVSAADIEAVVAQITTVAQNASAAVTAAQGQPAASGAPAASGSSGGAAGAASAPASDPAAQTQTSASDPAGAAPSA